ncbi:MAG TPA: hypothetical protein VK195_15130, partial [Burkholderiaceae bacterium]|nr:hypothetical protein [Burkholderiaceae bacterium]
PLYRIRVALDRQDVQAYGASLPLKPGMSLDADVLQQRQKVWEWVLEPILAVSGLAPFVNTPDGGSPAPQKAGASR